MRSLIKFIEILIVVYVIYLLVFFIIYLLVLTIKKFISKYQVTNVYIKEQEKFELGIKQENFSVEYECD